MFFFPNVHESDKCICPSVVFVGNWRNPLAPFYYVFSVFSQKMPCFFPSTLKLFSTVCSQSLKLLSLHQIQSQVLKGQAKRRPA
jgi:hypothetical protein